MVEFDLQTRMQRAHDRYLDRYEHAALIINVIGDALLDRLNYIRLQPKYIVDLGSSLGYMSRALHTAFPSAEILAIDLNHRMNQQATLKKTKNLHHLTANVYQLPIKSNSVDLIIGNLILPALLDYPALWQECQRILSPDGVLMFSNLGPDTLTELRASFASINDYPHLNTFVDLHDVGDGLLQAEFTDPVLDAEIFQLSYPSLIALLHELKNLGSIKYLEENQQRYWGKFFWQQVEQYYQQHFSDAKHRLVVSVDAYFAHARKPLKKPQRLDADGNIAIHIEHIKRPLSS